MVDKPTRLQCAPNLSGLGRREAARENEIQLEKKKKERKKKRKKKNNPEEEDKTRLDDLDPSSPPRSIAWLSAAI